MWTRTITFLLMCSHCFVRCLDSNVIRSSKEMTDPEEQVPGNTGVHNSGNARRKADTSSNRHRSVSESETCRDKSKRPISSNHQSAPDGHKDRAGLPEAAPCVRSGDCESGLCCARYLTGKRCKRAPVEGDTCTVGRSKTQRILGHCPCKPGLICRAQPDSPKGQGVCQLKPRSRNKKRAARHSDRKRRTERTCG